jgi:soluble lytic murein transglycosylase-like protein
MKRYMVAGISALALYLAPHPGVGEESQDLQGSVVLRLITVAELPYDPQRTPTEVKDSRASAPNFAETICLRLARASLRNGLPVDFFTRLIWQESHFNPRAQSYAGAQGIAQFMPATARARGLADSFDPLAAIEESAEFLRELRTQFGNLGLAAAAYNAGPGRVRAWLDGRSPLPLQTRTYVHIITGRAANTWVGVGDKSKDRMGTTISCDAIAKLLAPRRRQH